MIRFSEKAVLTLLLFAFAALVLYLTLELSRVARLVPLSVAIPTVGLLLLQLLLDLVPGLSRRYGGFKHMKLYRIEWVREKIRTSFIADPGVPAQEPQAAKVSMFAWLIMMLSLVYLLGFLIAMPLYTLLYLRRRSGEGWLLSLAVAGATWSLPYGVFHLALRTRLHEGQLWAWLGL